MTAQSFSLRPFPGSRPSFLLKITGSIARRGHILGLRYELRGDLAAVKLPEPAGFPARREGLWQETCLEFFLALQNSPRYWEINLSPAGHWNVYSFQGYRQGMAEEPALTSLPFTVQRGSASLLLTLEADLAGLIPAAQTLDVAISAVIKDRDGEITYWALTHPGPQADFHRREAFFIKL
jgi:hypothetical protein